MVSKYTAYRRGYDTIPPDVIDRILLGVCAAIWLALLGVSVAATVALADLGRGYHKSPSSPHTTWVLYAVIIVSALIIAGAVPVLLRARRLTQPEADATPAATATRATGRPLLRPGSPTPRTVAERAREQGLQPAAPSTEWSGAAVDRLWLRGTVILAIAIGGALTAVAAATYSMAVGHDGPSWVGYVVAGLITAAMPAVEWFYVRQLRRLIDAP